MIERLVISRFRGIKKGVLKDIGKFNLLVGPNNSGKTAVLEALYWLSVCGRKCRVLPERSDIQKEMAMTEIGFDANIPIKKDVSGYSPCPNIWERHGKPDKWYKSPGDIINQGLYYRIPHLPDTDILKSFRIITPQDQEIIDNNKLIQVDLESNCVFTSDQTEGMGDILKYYYPDLFPDSFSFPEKKERRYVFMWFQDFIYQGKSLGAWGIEGKPANADCVLFYDFHATSSHFKPDIIDEINKIPIFERRLKESFNNVFPISDFDVSIGHYPDSDGEIQGIIKQAGMRPIPIDDFGDGARHAFKVLAALTILIERCKDGKEGIFLWEDPELFMHPEFMWRLLNQVMDMVQDKPIQVFICTQNFEFIKYFEMILTERTKLREKSRLFRFDTRDGELVSAISTYTKLKGWLESSWDPRFWNQMDVLIHHTIEKGDEEDVSGE